MLGKRTSKHIHTPLQTLEDPVLFPVKNKRASVCLLPAPEAIHCGSTHPAAPTSHLRAAARCRQLALHGRGCCPPISSEEIVVRGRLLSCVWCHPFPWPSHLQGIKVSSGVKCKTIPARALFPSSEREGENVVYSLVFQSAEEAMRPPPLTQHCSSPPGTHPSPRVT